ncbi:hypothetical protein [Streptomyces sp. SID8352]|uniref:hypothetical protein n=1 Tax=Streptomyces sp. SID8352 TaxID=2690338 RepID=UPI00136CFFFB|nr:hypothetical protein [Streptomyces sp. SID8352]MYU26050.1 hypothetical protein [Streptomyces sp. SID8352]
MHDNLSQAELAQTEERIAEIQQRRAAAAAANWARGPVRPSTHRPCHPLAERLSHLVLQFPDRACIDALGPDRPGTAVLAAGQAGERLVDDALVSGGELPGGLGVIGGQGRWNARPALGETPEPSGLEVRRRDRRR